MPVFSLSLVLVHPFAAAVFSVVGLDMGGSAAAACVLVWQAWDWDSRRKDEVTLPLGCARSAAPVHQQQTSYVKLKPRSSKH